MGKGEIISEIGDGYYSVKIVYGYRDKVEQRIGNMENQIVLLNQKIAEAPDGLEKQVMELQVVSLEKQIAYLGKYFPSDPTRDLWCSDFTTGLTGDVGLIEIPDEIAEKITLLNSQSKQTTPKYTKINVRPGFTDQAVYSEPRDGEIVPVVAMSAAQMFWNKSALPGVQKWKPRFRYGVIVVDSIDFQANTCSVCLDPEYSSQQNLGVNQGDTFSECTGLRPSGFDQFCTDNPTHPTCINTEEGGGYWITDEMLVAIKEINESVNFDHEYETDKSGYGIGENWTEMSPGQKGDCEDYALTKQKALYDSGVPIQHLQLAIGETETGGWHAFLMIQSGNRGTIILDNRYNNVMNLDNVPYRFTSYQKSGSEWNGYGVRLTDVPVEYMSCNAAAFSDGDQVVVEFTGQDFSQPKVIGFKANPSACGGKCFVVAGQYDYPTDDLWGWVFDLASDSYGQTSTKAGVYGGGNPACGSPDNGHSINYCGGRADGAASPVEEQNIYKKHNFQYTVITDAWTNKTDMDIARNYLGCFPIGAELYFLCGVNDSGSQNRNNLYNSGADSWLSRSVHPLALTYFGTFVLSNKGHTVGGQAGGFADEHYAYDPGLDSYVGKTKHPSSILMGPSTFEDATTGKGYVCGGYQSPKPDIDSILVSEDPDFWSTESLHEYNPVTDAWTRKADWLTDGYDGIFVYSPPNPPPGGWTVDPADEGLKTGKDGQGPFNIPAAGDGIGNGMFFQSAYNEGGGVYNVVPNQEYTPRTDIWERKTQMPVTTFYFMTGGSACQM
jgi:predicted transglutaminase-like cysteine proteinase